MTLDLAKLRAETLALIQNHGGELELELSGSSPRFPYAYLKTRGGQAVADLRYSVTRNYDMGELLAAAPTLAADTLRLLDEIERLRGALEPSVKALQVAKRELWDLQRGYWTKDDFLNHAAVQIITDALYTARAALAEGGPDDR